MRRFISIYSHGLLASPNTGRFAAFFCLLLFGASSLFAQQDVTPPVLTEFSFSPTHVDTTSNAATVTFSAQVTDDLSGVSQVYAVFGSPSGAHSTEGYLGLQSGNTLNGTYQGGASFPAFGEPGTWTVEFVYVVDTVGNSHSYETSELQSLGFSTTLNVTSQQDVTPPVLTEFSFSPTHVDTTSNAATVTFSAQVTDDLSGVSQVYAVFGSPSGAHSTEGYLGLQSGNTLNGTYQGGASFPAFGEPGTWTVEFVYVVDTVGNSHSYETSELQSLGFSTTLNVTSQQDVTPPVLTEFSFSPTHVDTTSNAATVTFSAQVTDDLSGVSQVYAVFGSPSGAHSTEGYLGLQSGNTLNGTYQGGASFPAFGEPGTWTVEFVYVVDTVGNSHSYETSELQSLGFSTTLQVGILPGTTTSFQSSQNPSAYGQTVTFTAQVHTQTGQTVPTGTVIFSDGATQLVQVALDGNGDAVFSTGLLSLGTHTIEAAYFGGNNFFSSGANIIQQVTKGITSTSLSSATNPAISGQAVLLTATVTATGTPAGSVTFYDGAAALTTVPLTGNQAAYSTSSLAVGTHILTASYSGDGTYASSTSAALYESVVVVQTGTYLYGVITDRSTGAPLRAWRFELATLDITLLTAYGATDRSDRLLQR